MTSGHTNETERSEREFPVRNEVIRKVASWEGVSIHEHRFGGVEFRHNHRELGHLHPLFADLPLPRSLRDELVSSGRVKPHHVVPNSNWVTVPMRSSPEAENVITLLRGNYERAIDTSGDIRDVDSTENRIEHQDGQ